MGYFVVHGMGGIIIPVTVKCQDMMMVSKHLKLKKERMEYM